MPATFDAFFSAATGHEPYDYQRRLAGASLEGSAPSEPSGSEMEGEPPGEPKDEAARKLLSKRNAANWMLP